MTPKITYDPSLPPEDVEGVMIDLETMGTDPDAAIVSIGAVGFSVAKATISHTFYSRVALGDAVAQGGTMNPSTILWWMQQADEARRDIYAIGASRLPEALIDFARFMQPFQTPGVWGNGATFDNVILRSAYERAGLHTPWSYRQDRCFRTLKSLHPDVPEPTREGTHHNALDDAKHQTTHLLRMLA